MPASSSATSSTFQANTLEELSRRRNLSGCLAEEKTGFQEGSFWRDAVIRQVARWSTPTVTPEPMNHRTARAPVWARLFLPVSERFENGVEFALR
jgi:hypothetical protein